MTIPAWVPTGLGAVIALTVLIVGALVLMGAITASPAMVILLITLLALARLT